MKPRGSCRKSAVFDGTRTRQAQLVFDHVQRGNALLAEDARIRAAVEFRAALELDPENRFALERLAETTRAAEPDRRIGLPARLTDTGEIHLEPRNDRATFTFSGNVRALLRVGDGLWCEVQFDDSVPNRR